MSNLQQRLADGAVIVLDGGMGTEIQARGVPMDGEAWSAIANLTHADVVRGIHEDYIRAGAEIVIANTFPAGLGALTAAGLADKVVEINRAAVAHATEARERTGEPDVAVAGSMSHFAVSGLSGAGTTAAAEAFRVQAHALADAGVDLIVLEMMRSQAVAEPALEAAAETGLPVWFGVSIGEVGPTGALTLDGEDVDRLLELARDRAEAVMIMHTDIDVAGRALPLVKRAWPGPVGAYPHVGDWTPPNWVFGEISPKAFAEKIAPWAQEGAQVLGGCCGIGPPHIAALRRQWPLAEKCM